MQALLSRKSIARFRRACRGSVYIETGASILLLFLLVVGLTRVMIFTDDLSREQRVLRAAADLVWQIEEERGTAISQATLDTMRENLMRVGRYGSDGDLKVIVSIFDADAANVVSLAYSGQTGNLAQTTRLSSTAAAVSVAGEDYSLEDNERLVVVEIFLHGRGLEKARVEYLPVAMLKDGPV